MAKLVLLYTVFIFGLVFMFIPRPENPVDFFLLSDMKLYPATYIYFICERVTLIVLSWLVWYQMELRYQKEAGIFFYLMVADLIDYLVGYNEVWVRIGLLPISMNTVSAFIFGIVILRAWWKSIGL